MKLTYQTLFLSGYPLASKFYANDTSYGIGNEHLPFQSISTENFELDYNNHNEPHSVQNALNRGPYFDISASKNVTALVGKTANLNCRIKNLGNKTVSIHNAYNNNITYLHIYIQMTYIYKCSICSYNITHFIYSYHFKTYQNKIFLHH